MPTSPVSAGCDGSTSWARSVGTRPNETFLARKPEAGDDKFVDRLLCCLRRRGVGSPRKRRGPGLTTGPAQATRRKCARPMTPDKLPDRPTPLIIATASRKGGAGKSSLVALLAAHYSAAGRSVLIVDLDVQGSLSMTLGHVGAPTAGRVLTGERMSGDAEVRVADRVSLLTGGPGVESDLVEANPTTAGATLRSLAVDLVLLDTPPGHPAIDELAAGAADVLLAPCEPNRMGIGGASRAVQAAFAIRPGLRVAYVLSRVDARRSLDRAMLEALAGAVAPLPVFQIPQDAALVAELSGGRLPSKGRALEAVATIADWIDR